MTAPEALGPPAALDPAVLTTWTMMYRGVMPHSAFALGRTPAGLGYSYVASNRRSAAGAEAAAQAGCPAAE